MERSNMAFSSRHGAAHKAVTLDLMLRTFMNSQDFQPHNPRMWEGIARLVPGTTPQQVRIPLSGGILSSYSFYVDSAYRGGRSYVARLDRLIVIFQFYLQRVNHYQPIMTM